ncbi:MAG: WG repeat-containing protein [Saprospiraceae bacterium]
MKELFFSLLIAFSQIPLAGQVQSFNSATASTDTVKWDYIGDFTFGLAPVRLDSQWGFIDTFSNLKIPLKYKYAESFQTEDWGETWKAVVLNDENYVFIDSNGNDLGDYKHPNDNYPEFFTRKLSSECKDDISFLKDDVGGVLLQNKNYIFIGSAAGMISIQDKSTALMGIMDYSGRVLIPPMFDYIGVFGFRFYDLAPARLGKKMGYINKAGKIILPFIYDVAFPFCDFGCAASSETASVEKNGKSFSINREGKCIYNCN